MVGAKHPPPVGARHPPPVGARHPPPVGTRHPPPAGARRPPPLATLGRSDVDTVRAPGSTLGPAPSSAPSLQSSRRTTWCTLSICSGSAMAKSPPSATRRSTRMPSLHPGPATPWPNPGPNAAPHGVPGYLGTHSARYLERPRGYPRGLVPKEGAIGVERGSDRILPNSLARWVVGLPLGDVTH